MYQELISSKLLNVECFRYHCHFFLGRTFPGHPYFTMQLGSGQLALFNLLKAYSLMDQEVGYCQGLSFVAGILLMHVSGQSLFGIVTVVVSLVYCS